MAPPRIVVGIPDGSLAAYPRAALTILADTPVEAHVILPEDPDAAFDGTALSREWVEATAAATYSWGNVGAPMASGSWRSAGVLVVPCPPATTRDVAQGFTANLLTRAADVALKERTELVVVPSEPDWDGATVDHMVTITEAGGIVYPPFPSFYTGITDTEAMVARITKRALARFDIPVDVEAWRGLSDG